MAESTCAADSCVPTHSSTESAPIPLVNSLIRSTPSSPRSVTISVAPNSRASFCRDTTHHNDPLGAHLLRREHAQQANRTVTDNRDRLARLHVRRIRGKPSRWHAQQRHLRRADELRVLARGLITDLAVGTGCCRTRRMNQ